MRLPLFIFLIMGVSSIQLFAEQNSDEVKAIALAKISKWLDIPQDHFNKSAVFEQAVFSHIPKGTAEAEARSKINAMFADPPSGLKMRASDLSETQRSIGIVYRNEEGRWFEVIIIFQFSVRNRVLDSVKGGFASGREPAEQKASSRHSPQSNASETASSDSVPISANSTLGANFLLHH